MNVESVIEKFLHQDKAVSPKTEQVVSQCRELVSSTEANWHKNGEWRRLWTSWAQHFSYDSQRIIRIQTRVINLDKNTYSCKEDGCQPFLGRPLYAYRNICHLTQKYEMLFSETVEGVRLSVPPDIIHLLTLAMCTMKAVEELRRRLLPGIISLEGDNTEFVQNVLIKTIPRIEAVLSKHGGWDCLQKSNSWLTVEHKRTLQLRGDEGNI